eukprot:8670617-Heterocapsa_arctica.AAC.1
MGTSNTSQARPSAGGTTGTGRPKGKWFSTDRFLTLYRAYHHHAQKLGGPLVASTTTAYRSSEGLRIHKEPAGMPVLLGQYRGLEDFEPSREAFTLRDVSFSIWWDP